MAQTVVGFFDSSEHAQKAVDQLVINGFSRESVDLSINNNSTSTDSSQAYRRDEDDNKGGIGGFFSSLFGDDDDEREKYSTVGARSTIVTVHALDSSEAERAADILDDAGAIDVDERATQYRSGAYTGYTDSDVTAGTGSTVTGLTDETVGTGSTVTGLTDDTNVKVPIIEENLQVGKRTVETGGVRLRSRIVERPVEESVRLRQERVWVERTPVDRPASDADFTTFKEGQVEVTEHAEVPVVGKEARVVEEVTLNKDVTERDETIHETVRRTDVDVEQVSDSERTYNTDRDLDTRTRTDL